MKIGDRVTITTAQCPDDAPAVGQVGTILGRGMEHDWEVDLPADAGHGLYWEFDEISLELVTSETICPIMEAVG